MRFHLLATFFVFTVSVNFAQLPVGRDTLTVFENGKVLKSSWAGGLNFCQFYKIDLNNDGKKDIIAFDKVSSIEYPIFRCFLNISNSGQALYRFDASYSTQLPTVESWVFFYDYNSDGKEDLFTYVVGGIKVFKNISTASNLNFQLVKSRLKSDFNPTGTPLLGNIYSSPQSIPGFADIDNDGDVDILTFSSTGFKMEYHKNQSKELYNHTDSLTFDMVDYCWGDVSESNCAVTLFDCPYPKLFNKPTDEIQKILHSGSCLMCFDRDNDGDHDVIMGDVSCQTVIYMENGGSSNNAHITDTTALYPNYPSKANTQTIKLGAFPCTYYLDVDNDGKKDLLASPNSANSENYTSVWYYQNIGSSTNDFQFVKNNFLQDEMIDVGEGAYPAFFDYNADGLQDLLIGNNNYYVNGSKNTRLTLYQNIGNLSQPSYSLITRDYASMSTALLTYTSMYGLVPTTGDIDGDGDTDIILGDTYGKIHWLENTGGAGNLCNFSNFKYNYFGITTTSSDACPQLIDVNRDGLLDLIIGMRNGSIAYYRNNGTAIAPSFINITNTFGNLNVRGNPSVYLFGSCFPFMYDDAGTYKLLCGSMSGRIYYYDNIDGNLTGSFNRIDTNVNKIYEGVQCSVNYLDLNNDGIRDLIVGNYSGGLSFFSSKNAIGIFENDNDLVDEFFNVYPNPANDALMIRSLKNNSGNLQIQLYDVVGNLVYNQNNTSTENKIDTKVFAKGVYILHLRLAEKNQNKVFHKKIIIE